MATGTYSTVVQFDSDNFSANSSSLQLQQTQCTAPQNLDPNLFAYWIEAEVIKNAASGDARLGIVHVQQCETMIINPF